MCVRKYFGSEALTALCNRAIRYSWDLAPKPSVLLPKALSDQPRKPCPLFSVETPSEREAIRQFTKASNRNSMCKRSRDTNPFCGARSEPLSQTAQTSRNSQRVVHLRSIMQQRLRISFDFFFARILPRFDSGFFIDLRRSCGKAVRTFIRRPITCTSCSKPVSARLTDSKFTRR